MKTLYHGILFFILTLAIVFSSCQSNEEVEGVEELVFDVSFNPFPPNDLEPNASDTALISFAWEEFLALNWKSSFNENGLRDYPDTTWNWSSDSLPFTDLQVWETYAHRTELRPYSNQMLPFDDPPHYSFGTNIPPLNPGDSFTLFNNLDENNEIGSCNMYAHTDEYDQEIMVLYQAKVNRDEYDYIKNNYGTQQALASAVANTLNNITNDSVYYPGATNTCDCPKQENVICLPCGNNETGTQGAMEIKTAWRLLTPLDDTTKFFRRTVLYYEIRNDSIFYSNREFGLIGLHIIHKTTNYPAFVFATWEHVDVEAQNMGYVLLDNNGNQTGPLYSHFPRLHPIPDIVNQSTEEVHAQIAAKNKNSVWLNYRLVGVQAAPTSDSTSFSFFLANYVVESDTTLQDFHGNGIGTPHNQLPNILLNKQFYAGGGCQGCHGVAQIKVGTDFSFLLDNVGKPVLAPDIIDSLPNYNLAKLGKLIKLTSGKKK